MQNAGTRWSLLDAKQSYLRSDLFTRREKIALRYTDALMRNPLDADDEMWRELHEEFSEPELVALGYYIGFRVGAQRCIMTQHPEHGEYKEFLAKKRVAAPSRRR